MNWDEIVQDAILALDMENLEGEVDMLADLISGHITTYDHTSLEEYLKSSETDARAFHGLRAAVVKSLDAGWPLPIFLNRWVAGVLSGAIESPKLGYRDFRGLPGENTARDFRLHQAVTQIHEKFNLSIYQNDETPGALSALSAVAEAMRRLGLRPASYSGVKKAYSEVENEFRAGRRPDIAAAVAGWLIDN